MGGGFWWVAEKLFMRSVLEHVAGGATRFVREGWFNGRVRVEWVGVERSVWERIVGGARFVPQEGGFIWRRVVRV